MLGACQAAIGASGEQGGERDVLPVGRVVKTMTLTTSMTTTTTETSKGGEPKLELLQLASRVCNLVAMCVINNYASCVSPHMLSSTPRKWC
jgi:hypothetical protein